MFISMLIYKDPYFLFIYILFYTHLFMLKYHLMKVNFHVMRHNEKTWRKYITYNIPHKATLIITLFFIELFYS